MSYQDLTLTRNAQAILMQRLPVRLPASTCSLAQANLLTGLQGPSSQMHLPNSNTRAFTVMRVLRVTWSTVPPRPSRRRLLCQTKSSGTGVKREASTSNRPGGTKARAITPGSSPACHEKRTGRTVLRIHPRPVSLHLPSSLLYGRSDGRPYTCSCALCHFRSIR